MYCVCIFVYSPLIAAQRLLTDFTSFIGCTVPLTEHLLLIVLAGTTGSGSNRPVLIQVSRSSILKESQQRHWIELPDAIKLARLDYGSGGRNPVKNQKPTFRATGTYPPSTLDLPKLPFQPQECHHGNECASSGVLVYPCIPAMLAIRLWKLSLVQFGCWVESIPER